MVWRAFLWLSYFFSEQGSGLGKDRYVVEAAFDWLFIQRRLRVRYEKRDDILNARVMKGN
jgi:hypothetical protein